MKQMRFWLAGCMFLLISVALTACGDDDDAPTSVSNELVGTWTTNGITIVLNENGTGTYAQGGNTYSFTYVYDQPGGKVTVTVDGETQVYTVVSVGNGRLSVDTPWGDRWDLTSASGSQEGGDGDEDSETESALLGDWGYLDIPYLRFTSDEMTMYDPATGDSETYPYTVSESGWIVIYDDGDSEKIWLIEPGSHSGLLVLSDSDGETFAFTRLLSEGEEPVVSDADLYGTWNIGMAESMTFEADGTGTYSDGGYGEPFTYTYSSGSHELHIALDGETVLWKVRQLNDSCLIFEEEGELSMMWR